MTLTPEQVATQMERLNWERRKSLFPQWYNRELGLNLSDAQADYLCQTIQDRVEEAEKQARSDGWDANKQNAIYMFRNLAAKIDYYQSSGASDEDTIKGIHQWLDDQDRRLHFGEMPKLYTQQEVDAKIREARMDELLIAINGTSVAFADGTQYANLEEAKRRGGMTSLHQKRYTQLKNGDAGE